jgi:2-hydroxychromene-2-carboxylate isomerase
MSNRSPPECIFYFDIVCPYAYIASTRVDGQLFYIASARRVAVCPSLRLRALSRR